MHELLLQTGREVNRKPTLLIMPSPHPYFMLQQLLVLFHGAPLCSSLLTAMAFKISTNYSVLFFFFSTILIICALCRSSGSGEQVAHTKLLALKKDNISPEDMRNEEGSWRSARRLMIGSTAPVCTYNECRGCRLKCSAKQVPVDASDPINSPYRYRCVCHR